MSNLSDASFLALINPGPFTDPLRLSFPNHDGPSAPMLVNRLEAMESLSRDFRFDVEVMSNDAHITPKEMLGKMASVALARADGSLRHFNGYIFAFRQSRTDGGRFFYDMVLRPWLAYLRLRREDTIRPDQHLSQQTIRIFRDYEVSDSELRIHGADTVMGDAHQQGEKDYNFLHRCWEQLGWHYWYEHRADGHTLVLADDSTEAAPIDGHSPAIALERAAGTVDGGTLFEWTQVRTPVAEADTQRLTNSARGDAELRLRREEIAVAGEHFEGGGNDRFVQPGRWFLLRENVGGDENQCFLIVDVRHSASNNYQTDTPIRARYANALTGIHMARRWRPGRGYNSSEADRSS